DQIREVLRKTVSSLGYSEFQQTKYFSSATHQEILAGALDLDEDLEHPSGHVLALERVLKDIPQTKDFMDLDATGNPDEECQTKLDALKKELKGLLADEKNYITYQADWIGDKPVLEDPEAFADLVYEFLKDIIFQQIDQIINPDEIKHEQNLHEEFKSQLTEHFSGRVDLLEQVGSYIDKDPVQKPLSLIGASGSGKSSVMAQAIQEIEEKYPDAVLVYRFIGATSGSTSLISLLQSVGGQIAAAFGSTLESMANFESQKALYELSSLSEVFKQCLALSTSERPIYIFLDALDQLSNYEDNPFYWLPSELPEHTRFVVSVLPEIEPVLSNTSLIHLPGLNKLEAEQIIAKWLHASKRTLTSSQQQYLLDKFNNTGLALYLKLAFEQAKKWHSDTDNYFLQDDVPGMINGYIDSLHDEHIEEFVQDVICLMLCGRYQGLAENEILEIFAFDEELWNKFLGNTHERHRKELIDMRIELKGQMKIPIVVWSRLFLDLEPFLAERDADGVPIIAFFHRQFNEVLRERYELIGSS
ncbi:MAG: ATP-binding protein, partial [Saprospiraceae bacterium]|nr:ATP-binding protein [Saprospiraceae bacterium]